jgi:hypothetical protein
LLTVYGDDLLTDAKDGLAEGETISLRAFNSASNETISLEVEWNKAFASADGLFAGQGLSQITHLKTGITGGGENYLAASVEVYPNPASDVVTINLTGLQDLSGFTATLLTTDGRPVKTFALTGEKTTVDISSLQPGIYLMSIRTPANAFTHRIPITP